MSIIYETKGRAREYFELAANLYSGCEHKCSYCYGAEVTRTSPLNFFRRGTPRHDVLRRLDRDADRLAEAGEQRPVLLSFITDPYQPVEAELFITRYTIDILHHHGLKVAILTKAGKLAMRDLDILQSGDRFGVTLTFNNEIDSVAWEPGAGSPRERMRNLAAAHGLGIRTFASFEPVISPTQTLGLIADNAVNIDDFLVGRWNYDPEAEDIDWMTFAQDAMTVLENILKRFPNRTYYLKRDLARSIGHPQGFRRSNRIAVVKT